MRRWAASLAVACLAAGALVPGHASAGTRADGDTMILYPAVSQVSFYDFGAADGQFVVHPQANGALYAGPTDASSGPVQVSPSGSAPRQVATDGENVVWVDGYNSVMRTSLSSGTTEQLATIDPAALVFSIAVSDENVVWAQGRNAGGSTFWDVVLRKPDGTQVTITDAAKASGWQPSVTGTTVAYRMWDAATQNFVPALYDIATGTTTTIPVDGVHVNVSNVIAGPSSVVWLQNSQDHRVAAVKRANLDGSGVTDIVASTSAFPPDQGFVDANDGYATYTTHVDGAAKVMIVPVSGGAPMRVSCDADAQSMPRIDAGGRVIWTQAGNLVTQSDPEVKVSC